MARPTGADIVARFKADPNSLFSDEELAALDAIAAQDLWAAKALALNFFRKNEPQRALPYATRIAEAEPSDESIVNVVVVMRSLRMGEEAARFLDLHRATVDPIRYHDAMCSIHAGLGRTDLAVKHGDEALRLKDAALAPVDHRYRLNDTRSGRKVMTFSVWGSDSRYLTGAMNNAVVARYLYPGWTIRFYTDASTPEAFRAALRQNGAEVTMMEEPAESFGLFWRFYVEDDEDVDLYIVRDADSVVNIKERAAVAEWLHSDKAFHVMRDHPQHSELMLAGMWGAHRGNIGEMRRRIQAYVAGLPRRGNYVHKDQHFLREQIWPIARGSTLIHDAYFNAFSPRRFDRRFDLPPGLHIGQNDWVHYRQEPKRP